MAIHIASANGRDDVVRVLLNRDKRLVNVRDDDRTTFGLETPGKKKSLCCMKIASRHTRRI